MNFSLSLSARYTFTEEDFLSEQVQAKVLAHVATSQITFSIHLRPVRDFAESHRV